MKKNQKGFSVVEVLIILIVGAVVGCTGWLISQKNKNTGGQTITSAEISKTEAPLQKSEPKTTTVTAAKNEELSYEVEEGKMFFTPKTGWEVKSTELSTDDRGQMSGSIALSSPDHTYFTPDDGSECSGVKYPKTGMLISIYIKQDAKDMTTQQYLDKVLSNSFILSWDPEETKMGGLRAVSYFTGPGECFHYFETQTGYQGYSYSVSTMSNLETSAEFKDSYDSLISSIRFEQ